MFEMVPICIHILTVMGRNSPACLPEDAFLFTEGIKFFFDTRNQLWVNLCVFFLRKHDPLGHPREKNRMELNRTVVQAIRQPLVC